MDPSVRVGPSSGPHVLPTSSSCFDLNYSKRCWENEHRQSANLNLFSSPCPCFFCEGEMENCLTQCSLGSRTGILIWFLFSAKVLLPQRKIPSNNPESYNLVQENPNKNSYKLINLESPMRYTSKSKRTSDNELVQHIKNKFAMEVE